MRFTQSYCLYIIFLFSFFHSASAQQNPIYSADYYKTLDKTHDINLPAWGPYTKRYAGISHIPNTKSGIRTDFAVVPAYASRKVVVPSVKYETNWHPWQAEADLSYYTYRYDLEGKQTTYCDVSFLALAPQTRLIRANFVNNKDSLAQQLAIHFLASINFAPLRPYSNAPLEPLRAVLPPNAVWVDGLSYQDLQFARKDAKHDLIPDGYKRGEARENNTVGGTVIASLWKGTPWSTPAWGRDAGDFIIYQFEIKADIENAALLFRYQTNAGKKFAGKLEGDIDMLFTLAGSTTFATQAVTVGNLKKGKYRVKLISQEPVPLDLDGFAVVSASAAHAVKFEPERWHMQPEVRKLAGKPAVVLKYKNLNGYYGMAWTGDFSVQRELFSEDLEVTLPGSQRNHTGTQFTGAGNDKGHYYDVYVRPIDVAPRSERSEYALLCYAETAADVEKELDKYFTNKQGLQAYFDQHQTKQPNKYNPTAQPYMLAQQLTAANLLNNIVYPVYTDGTYIRHYTPGRIWDCLYTWDSGFIGIGLSQLDFERAIENLNAYTMPVGAQSAFVHHGSPLPVQIFQFAELYNQTQSEELLRYFYPRLKQYHAFLVGRWGSSDTRRLSSGLLNTWSYFYNSGGWDDYPPQVYVHKNNMSNRVAPVINTALAIRTAKLLKMAALKLNLNKDTTLYNKDITELTYGLQKYAWDEESGYFGYVVHDTVSGRATDILRAPDKSNFNQGIDGITPLIAGICTPNQQQKLLAHLVSKNELWTNVGITTVSQAASYYTPDGYWNGNVWFPHQWFLWKTLLGMGEGEKAYQIAKTAIDNWNTEVNDSYNCYEHFSVSSGRGTGWHHFSGLSAPIVNWFAACYKIGTISGSFDIMITNRKTDTNGNLSNFKFVSGNAQQTQHILLCLDSRYTYDAFIQNKPLEMKPLEQGLYLLAIEKGTQAGEVTIRKR